LDVDTPPIFFKYCAFTAFHNLPIKSWINFQDFKYEDEEEKKTKKKNKWRREERRHKKL